MMKTMTKLLAGAAGLAAAVAVATPAAAQYPYGYNPYGNTGQNVVGQIINSVIGYGRYPYGNYGYGQPGYNATQIAVDQCARATEARLNGYRINDRYDRWDPNSYNPYGGWAMSGRARVLGIDDVRIRGGGRIRVKGVATSGQSYRNPYGYGSYAYNRQYGSPDLRFSCNADRSGRVYDVDISRMAYYGRR
ncbi:MAG TPA: hypothetical protein VNR68_07430 [Sphingomicrobium sp.]|nr:hypothetical protein [Sphingomicrobium sp.]